MTDLALDTHGTLMGFDDTLALIQSNAKPFLLRRLKRMKQRSQD